MHVAVDQSRSQGGAFGIDDQSRGFSVEIFFLAHCRDLSVDGHDRIGVEDRPLQIAAQQQTDIADQKPGLRLLDRLIVGHEAHLFRSKSVNSGLSLRPLRSISSTRRRRNASEPNRRQREFRAPQTML